MDRAWGFEARPALILTPSVNRCIDLCLSSESWFSTCDTGLCIPPPMLRCFRGLNKINYVEVLMCCLARTRRPINSNEKHRDLSLYIFLSLSICTHIFIIKWGTSGSLIWYCSTLLVTTGNIWRGCQPHRTILLSSGFCKGFMARPSGLCLGEGNF